MSTRDWLRLFLGAFIGENLSILLVVLSNGGFPMTLQLILSFALGSLIGSWLYILAVRK